MIRTTHAYSAESQDLIKILTDLIRKDRHQFIVTDIRSDLTITSNDKTNKQTNQYNNKPIMHPTPFNCGVSTLKQILPTTVETTISLTYLYINIAW